MYTSKKRKILFRKPLLAVNVFCLQLVCNIYDCGTLKRFLHLHTILYEYNEGSILLCLSIMIKHNYLHHTALHAKLISLTNIEFTSCSRTRKNIIIVMTPKHVFGFIVFWALHFVALAGEHYQYKWLLFCLLLLFKGHNSVVRRHLISVSSSLN